MLGGQRCRGTVCTRTNLPKPRQARAGAGGARAPGFAVPAPPEIASLVLGYPVLYHGNVATNQLKWQYDDKLV